MSNKMQVAPSGVDRVSAPVCGRKIPSPPPFVPNGLMSKPTLRRATAVPTVPNGAGTKAPRGQGATGPEPEHPCRTKRRLKRLRSIHTDLIKYI